MSRAWMAVPTVIAGLLAGCAGGSHGVLPRTGGSDDAMRVVPKSISPGLVPAAPMAKTAILPPSAMQTPRKTAVALGGTNWVQLPGAASQVAAAPDGSLWVLSTQPSGSTDKYIWHYANGTWTNISGMASRLAVAPNGSLYALNSGGGTWLYQNGGWTGLGGGAVDLTAAQDGSVYVLSNAGGTADKAIWHNVKGRWTQLPGAGSYLAASRDTGTYALSGGTVRPGGFYVLNSQGHIYYGDASGSYVAFSGAAASVAPASFGGFFVLGYPKNAAGETLWYYDLSAQKWTSISGQAVSISDSGGHLYAVTSDGAIYMTNAQPAAGDALPNSNPFQYYAWSPSDVANAFAFPVQSGYDGMGETIAIVISAIPATGDVQQYLSEFGITRRGSIATEAVDGGGPADTEGEATLDAETIAGLAPGANVIVYDMPDLSGQSTLDAYNQILADGVANVVSMSYGGCEWKGVDTTTGTLFAQMAAQGIAAVASAGDTGNDCYENGSYIPGANNPASDPNVIGVGGTETDPISGVIQGTNLWNDCDPSSATPGNCMGSGNVSGNAANGFAGYPLPAYQAGLSGEASTRYRNVPDIALPADNDVIYLGSAGGWTTVEGTSWSAPQTAAMVAEIYEYCGVSAVRDPVTMFYTTYARDGYNDFLDVTTGNDSYAGSSPSFSAQSGFDNVSGIGSPYGMQIAQRLCPNNRPAMMRAASHAMVALQSPAPAQTRMLDNVVRPPHAADIGARDASKTTRVALVLRATPALANDEGTVIADLRAAGFTIVRTFRNHLVIDAQAPASIVERYFATRIDDFDQGRDGIRFANTQPDVLPASIAPYVSGVLTQNLVLAHGFRPRIMRHL